MIYVKAYIAALAVFLPVDAVWLSFVANEFYFSQLGDLVADEVRYDIAGAFYLMYVVGVVIFALGPAIERRSAGHAALFGALFGFFCYATYDLTNMATLKDWPFLMSYVDMVWGPVLTATTAWGGYQVLRALGQLPPRAAA
ncbi:MAG: DUF2177 family protein [Pseudomonadota bacterium]